jgi:hypothetical protein
LAISDFSGNCDQGLLGGRHHRIGFLELLGFAFGGGRLQGQAQLLDAAVDGLHVGHVGVVDLVEVLQDARGPLANGEADGHADDEDSRCADGQHPDFGAKVHLGSCGGDGVACGAGGPFTERLSA